MKLPKVNLNEEIYLNDPRTNRKTVEDILESLITISDKRLDYLPVEIQQMLIYMNQHLFEKTLTIEGLKKVFNLTNNNIASTFRQFIGVGPRGYIINKKLKAAGSLLYSSKTNIYLLANMLGYSEEAFSIVKKIMDIHRCNIVKKN